MSLVEQALPPDKAIVTIRARRFAPLMHESRQLRFAGDAHVRFTPSAVQENRAKCIYEFDWYINRFHMICYYCGRPATSYEHVPPKCIFFGNTDGTVNRKTLITVPSCDEHNSRKQKDDEYFRFLLIMSIYSTGINGTLNIEKFFRAIKRTPHVFSSFLINPQQVFVKHVSEAIYEPTIAYEADIPRYHRIINQICIGLFFYNFGEVFHGKIDIPYDGTISLSDQKVNDELVQLLKTVNTLSHQIPYLGDNKSIFQYKIIPYKNKFYIVLLFFETNEMLIRLTCE